MKICSWILAAHWIWQEKVLQLFIFFPWKSLSSNLWLHVFLLDSMGILQKRTINYWDWISVIKMLCHVNSHLANGASEKMWRSWIHPDLVQCCFCRSGCPLHTKGEMYICIYVYIYAFIICDGHFQPISFKNNKS